MGLSNSCSALAVKDSLELAVENAGARQGKSRRGQEATLQLLDKALKAQDVKTLDPWASLRSLAPRTMMAQPSTSAEPNSILKVVQRAMS